VLHFDDIFWETSGGHDFGERDALRIIARQFRDTAIIWTQTADCDILSRNKGEKQWRNTI